MRIYVDKEQGTEDMILELQKLLKLPTPSAVVSVCVSLAHPQLKNLYLGQTVVEPRPELAPLCPPSDQKPTKLPPISI